MQPRSAALLWDLATAVERIQNFVHGKSWDDYEGDVLLRSAVERQLEVAGEAMSVLRRTDPATAELVPEVKKIIGMRNVLIHGYAEVNNLTVWRTASQDLGGLVQVVEDLLKEAGPPVAPT